MIARLHVTSPSSGTCTVTMCVRTQAGSMSRYPGRPGDGRAANSPNSDLSNTGGSTASPDRKYGVSPGARTCTCW